MEYYSVIRKNEIMSFALAWMDVEIVIISEVRQRKTNKLIWYHLYVDSTKLIQMNLFTKQKQTHRLRKRSYGYQEMEGGCVEGIVTEFVIDMYTWLYLK